MLGEILKEFDICIPQEQYILEYFLENTESVYHLDFLPYSVKSKKYDEVNVIYQEAMSNSELMNRYMCIENRYVNTMIKLWIYSNVFINIDTVYTPARKIKKHFEKRFKKYVSFVIERDTYDEMIPIRNLEEMNFYVSLGCRDIANVIYYFKELDILMFTNWSCFTMVFLKNKYFEFVKKIAESEGLFLRKAKLPIDT